MAGGPPTSVLLPMTKGTDACRELAAQLRNCDELLVIHDRDDDHVTELDNLPGGIRLIAAGAFTS